MNSALNKANRVIRSVAKLKQYRAQNCDRPLTETCSDSNLRSNSNDAPANNTNILSSGDKDYIIDIIDKDKNNLNNVKEKKGTCTINITAEGFLDYIDNWNNDTEDLDKNNFETSIYYVNKGIKNSESYETDAPIVIGIKAELLHKTDKLFAHNQDGQDLYRNDLTDDSSEKFLSEINPNENEVDDKIQFIKKNKRNEIDKKYKTILSGADRAKTEFFSTLATNFAKAHLTKGPALNGINSLNKKSNQSGNSKSETALGTQKTNPLKEVYSEKKLTENFSGLKKSQTVFQESEDRNHLSEIPDKRKFNPNVKDLIRKVSSANKALEFKIKQSYMCMDKRYQKIQRDILRESVNETDRLTNPSVLSPRIDELESKFKTDELKRSDLAVKNLFSLNTQDFQNINESKQRKPQCVDREPILVAKKQDIAKTYRPKTEFNVKQPIDDIEYDDYISSFHFQSSTVTENQKMMDLKHFTESRKYFSTTKSRSYDIPLYKGIPKSNLKSAFLSIFQNKEETEQEHILKLDEKTQKLIENDRKEIEKLTSHSKQFNLKETGETTASNKNVTGNETNISLSNSCENIKSSHDYKNSKSDVKQLDSPTTVKLSSGIKSSKSDSSINSREELYHPHLASSANCYTSVTQGTESQNEENSHMHQNSPSLDLTKTTYSVVKNRKSHNVEHSHMQQNSPRLEENTCMKQNSPRLNSPTTCYSIVKNRESKNQENSHMQQISPSVDSAVTCYSIVKSRQSQNEEKSDMQKNSPRLDSAVTCYTLAKSRESDTQINSRGMYKSSRLNSPTCSMVKSCESKTAINAHAFHNSPCHNLGGSYHLPKNYEKSPNRTNNKKYNTNFSKLSNKNKLGSLNRTSLTDLHNERSGCNVTQTNSEKIMTLEEKVVGEVKSLTEMSDEKTRNKLSYLKGKTESEYCSKPTDPSIVRDKLKKVTQENNNLLKKGKFIPNRNTSIVPSNYMDENSKYYRNSLGIEPDYLKQLNIKEYISQKNITLGKKIGYKTNQNRLEIDAALSSDKYYLRNPEISIREEKRVRNVTPSLSFETGTGQKRETLSHIRKSVTHLLVDSHDSFNNKDNVKRSKFEENRLRSKPISLPLKPYHSENILVSKFSQYLTRVKNFISGTAMNETQADLNQYSVPVKGLLRGGVKNYTPIHKDIFLLQRNIFERNLNEPNQSKDNVPQRSKTILKLNESKNSNEISHQIDDKNELDNTNEEIKKVNGNISTLSMYSQNHSSFVRPEDIQEFKKRDSQTIKRNKTIYKKIPSYGSLTENLKRTSNKLPEKIEVDLIEKHSVKQNNLNFPGNPSFSDVKKSNYRPSSENNNRIKKDKKKVLSSVMSEYNKNPSLLSEKYRSQDKTSNLDCKITPTTKPALDDKFNKNKIVSRKNSYENFKKIEDKSLYSPNIKFKNIGNDNYYKKKKEDTLPHNILFSSINTETSYSDVTQNESLNNSESTSLKKQNDVNETLSLLRTEFLSTLKKIEGKPNLTVLNDTNLMRAAFRKSETPFNDVKTDKSNVHYKSRRSDKPANRNRNNSSQSRMKETSQQVLNSATKKMTGGNEVASKYNNKEYRRHNNTDSYFYDVENNTYETNGESVLDKGAYDKYLQRNKEKPFKSAIKSEIKLEEQFKLPEKQFKFYSASETDNHHSFYELAGRIPEYTEFKRDVDGLQNKLRKPNFDPKKSGKPGRELNKISKKNSYSTNFSKITTASSKSVTNLNHSYSTGLKYSRRYGELNKRQMNDSGTNSQRTIQKTKSDTAINHRQLKRISPDFMYEPNDMPTNIVSLFPGYFQPKIQKSSAKYHISDNKKNIIKHNRFQSIDNINSNIKPLNHGSTSDSKNVQNGKNKSYKEVKSGQNYKGLRDYYEVNHNYKSESHKLSSSNSSNRNLLALNKSTQNNISFLKNSFKRSSPVTAVKFDHTEELPKDITSDEYKKYYLSNLKSVRNLSR